MRRAHEIISFKKFNLWAPVFFVYFAGISPAADPKHGEQVARDANCLECHRIAGEGGRAGTSQAARGLDSAFLARYTAPDLASTLWNHTPFMREAVAGTTIPHPKITELESEDLFAYLYSLRFRDRPADAKAGAHAFEVKRCAECHQSESLIGRKNIGAPAVSAWSVSTDPFLLARSMWNHATNMKRAVEGSGKSWPEISGQDLLNINAYVRSVKGSNDSRNPAADTWPDPRRGQPLFDASCKQCHSGGLALGRMLGNKTLMDIAAGMWNHSPRMLTAQVVSGEEMGSVVAYAWEQQYMGAPGNAARGAEAFSKKHCAECHAETGALRFQRGEKIFTPFSLIALGWEHGTLMQQAMKQKKIRWPGLSAQDVADLLAYINSRP